MLSPGLLPSSLRELFIQTACEALVPESLPDGLEVLAFHPKCWCQQTILPGVIPASVRVLSMTARYSQPLVAGGVPASVRRLRLSREHYNEAALSAVLSPSTRVVWWEADIDDGASLR